MPCYRLERAQDLPVPVQHVFDFFSDAHNLEAITPPFLHFEIVTPGAIEIAAGTRIDYRLRLFGMPFGWRTRIEVFEPPVRFSDAQLCGPYRRWYHLHEFRAIPGGTRMLDRVDYELPLGPLGMAAHALVVRRTLARIFDHRAARILPLLDAARS